jgi:hypothetical protein
MRQMALDWASSLKQVKLSKSEAWIALTFTLWRSLLYPLPALNLTKKLCRNFPGALVFAPEKFFGLGIPHLYTIQEIYRLSDLILHNTKETMTGLLSKSTLELLIIELGSTIDLHLLPFTQLQGLASNSLIKSTWEFLHIHSIQLHHNITLLAPREDDVEIMTVFYQQNLPSDILHNSTNADYT